MGWWVCTEFNNCKFEITQTIKFAIAKLPETFYKNTDKKFKRKKTAKKNSKKKAHSRIEK